MQTCWSETCGARCIGVLRRAAFYWTHLDCYEKLLHKQLLCSVCVNYRDVIILYLWKSILGCKKIEWTMSSGCSFLVNSGVGRGGLQYDGMITTYIVTFCRNGIPLMPGEWDSERIISGDVVRLTSTARCAPCRSDVGCPNVCRKIVASCGASDTERTLAKCFKSNFKNTGTG